MKGIIRRQDALDIHVGMRGVLPDLPEDFFVVFHYVIHRFSVGKIIGANLDEDFVWLSTGDIMEPFQYPVRIIASYPAVFNVMVVE